ncbi:TPA: YabP/YqfC family sporulation protein [Candidatus Avacholeplasma faecigallinarum]|nr:YabP/YqfC family sporulation protein [Candidatus Avacholeplasma faecigallinarum]
MKMILSENELEINNVTNLKEFNEQKFILTIDTTLYEIKGDGLELKEVYNNNTSLKISGNIYSIEKKDHKENAEKKSFLKRLFS